MQMLIVLMFWIFWGSLTSYLAKRRGRDPVAWFLLGMALQVIALIILYVLPSLEKMETTELELNEDEQMAGFEFPDPVKDFQNKEWFYVNADRVQHGPFTFEELQRKWADGEMSKLSYVWADGMADWCRVVDFPHFEASVNQLHLVRLHDH
jgi:hypothetical protein